MRLKELFIVITHAHADHVGALPVLRKKLEKHNIKVSIFATDPTVDIAMWNWRDKIKRMARVNRGAGYDYSDMYNLKKEIQIIYDGERKTLGPFDLSFLSAGHILGGTSVLVKVDFKTIFFSSDISFRDQHTIASAKKYSNLDLGHIDYLVTEFTYGDKDVPNRKIVFDELTTDIEKHLKLGGKVLLPVLSVGRAMEIFIELKKKKMIKRYDTWICGSAYTIAEIYAKYGAVKATLRKHSLSDYNEHRYVRHHAKPCIILAPAGMLSGGWANFFASHLIQDKKNLIALTCYQAPNELGSKIVKSKKGDLITFNKEGTFQLNASIGTYNLSAHASAYELRAMFRRLSPGKIFLVHGEERTIKGFQGFEGMDSEAILINKEYNL